MSNGAGRMRIGLRREARTSDPRSTNQGADESGRRASRWTPRTLVLVLWSVFALAMTTGIVGYLDRTRLAEADAAFAEAEAAAATVEQTLLRALEAVHSIQDLLLLRHTLQAQGNWEGAEAIESHLVGLITASRFGLLQISFTDPAGRIAWTTLPNGVGVSLADREAAQAHMTQMLPGLYLGAPVVGRLTGRWLLPVSKALRGPDSRLIGIGIVGLDAVTLSAALNRPMTGVGHIAVVRRLADGALLLRSDDAVARFGVPVKALHPLVQAARRVPRATMAYDTPLAQRPVLAAYRVPEGVPVVAAAVLDRRQVMAGFRQLAVATSAAGLTTVGGTLLVGLAWARSVHLHERLVIEATRDPLTGLHNRRSLEAAARDAITAAGPTRERLALLLFDLDRFKLINDSHGHDAGDTVLRDVAALLRVAVRPGDVACRWGGEELVLLLRHCDGACAVARAEDIRRSISGLYRDGSGPVPAVTASVGIACFPVQGWTLEQIVRAADIALYAAKGSGRDRVMLAAA